MINAFWIKSIVDKPVNSITLYLAFIWYRNQNIFEVYILEEIVYTMDIYTMQLCFICMLLKVWKFANNENLDCLHMGLICCLMRKFCINISIPWGKTFYPLFLQADKQGLLWK